MTINTINDLYGMADDKFELFLKGEGYINPRKLEDGEWVAIVNLAYSTSVCCGMDFTTAFKYRWCFSDPKEAHYFLENITEFDEIPTKKTSLVGHRYFGQPLYTEVDQLGFKKW